MRRDTVVRTLPGFAAAAGFAGANVLTGGVASAQEPGPGAGLHFEHGAPPGTSWPLEQAQSGDR